ncbi:unnamed protein product [Phaeothamnion confervicola]
MLKQKGRSSSQSISSENKGQYIEKGTHVSPFPFLVISTYMPEEAGWVRPLCGASAAITAEVVTLPVDIFKIRFQLANGRAARPAVSLICRDVYRSHGLYGFWFGLQPALLRQITIQSTKMAMYDPLKARIVAAAPGPQGQTTQLWHLMLAGGTAGAMGGLLGNPADLVKTRMQAGLSGPHYANVGDAFAHIVRSEGVAALWRGAVPMVQRSFLVNMAELAVYDKQTKSTIRESELLPEGLATTAGASAVAGFATACVSTPVDLAKTRLMTDGCGGARQYRGMAHVLTSVFQSEGPRGLYKGFVPTWLRVGPWAMVFFVAYERYRLAATDLAMRAETLPRPRGSTVGLRAAERRH